MKTRDLILCSLFAALFSISAFITIPLPFTPVPVTLQVMIIFIAAGILKKNLAATAVMVYILLGIFGLPVFSGFKGGIGVIAGVTGGYILGMIPAVYVASFICELSYGKKGSAFINALGMLTGLLIIYIFGTLQFMLIANVSIYKALISAVLPFIAADLMKLLGAVTVVSAVKKRLINQSA